MKFLLQNASGCDIIHALRLSVVLHIQGNGYSLPEKADAKCREKRLHGQAVKTSPFHGGNTGSIPVGVISFQGNAYN